MGMESLDPVLQLDLLLVVSLSSCYTRSFVSFADQKAANRSANKGLRVLCLTILYLVPMLVI